MKVIITNIKRVHTSNIRIDFIRGKGETVEVDDYVVVKSSLNTEEIKVAIRKYLVFLIEARDARCYCEERVKQLKPLIGTEIEVLNEVGL